MSSPEELDAKKIVEEVEAFFLDYVDEAAVERKLLSLVRVFTSTIRIEYLRVIAAAEASEFITKRFRVWQNVASAAFAKKPFIDNETKALIEKIDGMGLKDMREKVAELHLEADRLVQQTQSNHPDFEKSLWNKEDLAFLLDVITAASDPD